MYFNASAFQNLLPGEPTPDALHRQEYHESKPPQSDEDVVADPAIRQRAVLLRAQVITGVGSFFA